MAAKSAAPDAIRVGSPIPENLVRAGPISHLTGFLRRLGPGIVTGASDDDPSGIATYSQVGAQFGFAMLGTMLLSYPLMTAIQEVSAWLGRVTGSASPGNMRRHYSPWMVYPLIALLLIANVINIVLIWRDGEHPDITAWWTCAALFGLVWNLFSAGRDIRPISDIRRVAQMGPRTPGLYRDCVCHTRSLEISSPGDVHSLDFALGRYMTALTALL